MLEFVSDSEQKLAQTPKANPGCKASGIHGDASYGMVPRLSHQKSERDQLTQL